MINIRSASSKRKCRVRCEVLIMNRKTRVGSREVFFFLLCFEWGRKKEKDILGRNLSLLAGSWAGEGDDARSGGFDDLVRKL